MSEQLRAAPLLAIVVPCYNEEEVFPYCLRELKGLLGTMAGDGLIKADSFVLFVNDGSRDTTWKLIGDAVAANRCVRGLQLSRNEGHQSALMAGLAAVDETVEVIVSIDADLQDDVNAIRRMVEAYRAGYDVVYGVRENRETDTWFKRTSAEVFYRLMASMGIRQVSNHADFRLLSRRALDALLRYSECNAYIRGLVPMVGFGSTEVYYTRAVRAAGESKYPLRKMLALAVEGITSMTIMPLRLIAGMGFCICVLAFFATAYVLWRKFSGNTASGWPSIVLSIFFMGGVQMLSLGVIGEYIGKIYLEVKKRPRFHVESLIQNNAPEQ
ncbi:glycosyltransferase family 2 protein [Acetobacter suratthaniensis]|uniref:Glycosyltransferase family 2 protein n=1 Tax=Acetobacter suratthaniensis TaxID=1502841 RepID=A0ABS3LHR3_9PROT|nr:glycosyltransferase family 2 protein [Acetobacter suratthaniensis]MBO1327122.1 glycosyltransferase family 2 protein [Acetobacter suratthaniensis]MCX2565267.1 glycosyltransferase family 2 protein [Acetobacter suratthaniensis]